MKDAAILPDAETSSTKVTVMEQSTKILNTQEKY